MKKVNIVKILKSSFALYKSNLSKLLIFTSISTVFSILMTLFTFFTNTEIFPWFSMLFMLLALASIYFMFQSALAIQIYITDAINNKTKSIKNSFAEVRGKFWRYLGNIMLATFFLVPQLLITNYFNTSNNPYYFLITIPYICLFFPLYFLLDPTVALEDKDTLNLKK